MLCYKIGLIVAFEAPLFTGFLYMQNVASALQEAPMNIYPHYQLRPKLKGERQIYELLYRHPDVDGFAVHSVNLPEHEYKRWGEADFVIVSNNGVTLLEVKGGFVTIAGREWRYENGRGKAIISIEGPAQQSISAAVALEDLLSKHMGRKIRCRWGVCFPLCRFNKQLAELPPNRLADVSICKEDSPFFQWLSDIPYDQHDPGKFALNEREILAIKEILVPEFSASTSLGLAVRSSQNEVIKMTEQQFSILESLHSNPRICVAGGAGTGKTELATLCARAEKTAGRNPAILTSGSALSIALRSRMNDYDIPIVTRELPEGVDTLIVDEGQDYAQPEIMKGLFEQLPGGLNKGRWRWFMDPNLQFMKTPPDGRCLERLRDHSVNVSLNRNVRSTKEIVNAIRSFLNADVGISEIDGFGIKVGFHNATDESEELLILGNILTELLDDGIQPSEIAILGPEGEHGSICEKVISTLPALFRPLSSSSQILTTSHGVVAGISAFRGMEARIVILVDLELLPTDQCGKAMLYIGMSRASASLQLLVRPPARDYLKKLFMSSNVRE